MRLPRYEFDREYIERLVAAEPETERHFTRYFGELLTLKQKGGLATPESLGAFVNSVCNNVLFEMYRTGARTTPLDEEFDAPEDRATADTALMAAEERDKVREALAGLPKKEKDLLRWLFFEERDKDDICREMNIDRNYLRVLVHRAKTRFRDRLATLSSE